MCTPAAGAPAMAAPMTIAANLRYPGDSTASPFFSAQQIRGSALREDKAFDRGSDLPQRAPR